MQNDIVVHIVSMDPVGVTEGFIAASDARNATEEEYRKSRYIRIKWPTGSYRLSLEKDPLRFLGPFLHSISPIHGARKVRAASMKQKKINHAMHIANPHILFCNCDGSNT